MNIFSWNIESIQKCVLLHRNLWLKLREDWLIHSLKRKSVSKKLASDDVYGISSFGVPIRISEFRLRKFVDFRGSGVSKTCHPPQTYSCTVIIVASLKVVGLEKGDTRYHTFTCKFTLRDSALFLNGPGLSQHRCSLTHRAVAT
jgi:hypothetical protein